ncbi:site-2 protease family protein [Cellulomonas fengjieae]|uniref:Site-2 protease family protein n=1 Tax=Cellulomonas fengjieae TaxID=2819978 RepID=A0ABS3SJB5_9CELL|nr:site-2 protease family protein [Cellulomonas fengjieae]MBO3085846.1 site-2 protease family protein [Cellulomonas fengjieae]MBO3102956.1 site-2 protease family protein [Cellulomonas fengjieae]QVI67454.1 site-2 protease family protein [Cellulomonas fengjieae]
MSSPRPPARRSGWVIGRVVGAPIILAPSWLIAAVLLTLIFAPTVRARSENLGALVYVVALAFVVLLFASVLVHELAHGLMARARGQQPREFVLTLWGGHTAFGGVTPTPASSALIAVVGPLANLVLAAGFFAIAQGVDATSLVGLLIWSGCLTNAFVGLFNLIPGLPLDGGFLLEAAVWAATKNRHTGTVAAGWVGRVVAVGVFAWALLVPWSQGRPPELYDMVWGGLIGAFLWSGASAAVRGGRTQKAVGLITAASVGRRAVGVEHTVSIAHAGALAAAAGAEEVVILSPDGRPAAYVDRAAAASVPADVAGTTPVTAVAVPLPGGAVVDARLTGQELVGAVGRATEHSPVAAAVVDGRVVGLIRAMDVVAAIRS